MRVTLNGDVGIPKDVLDAAGIEPDSEVAWEVVSDGVLRLVRVAGPPPPPTPAEIEAWLDRIRGSATGGMTTDEIMALTRGE